MVGFVVLTQARAKVELNWEVTDLLKTASRQASHRCRSTTGCHPGLSQQLGQSTNDQAAHVLR